jgi:ribulose-phosphate 3-epimerase
MNFWSSYPSNRLLAEGSLWSADFTRFREEIQRIDPYIDLYHVDVSDAHFVPGLLFFPDLVAALRPLTQKAFHAHLMVDQPHLLVDEFAAAGANLITVHCELGPLAASALQRIADRGLSAGLVLGLDVAPEAILPYLDMIEVVVMMGTPMGVKGQELNRMAIPRIRRIACLLEEYGYRGKIKIEADGGIRTNTVPALRAAGADIIVMGSLAFKSSDLPKTFDWVHSLSKE